MNKPLKLGPLLSLEEENTYSICFLTADAYTAAEVEVTVNGIPFKTDEPKQILSGYFWRTSGTVTPKAGNVGELVTYSIKIRGTELPAEENKPRNFYVPALEEKPKMAYTSCNGFSSLKLLKDTDKPYALWERMNDLHTNEPFSLLVMGGDQLYADEIWSAIPELKDWSHENQKKQKGKICSPALINKFDKFYEELYISRWNEVNQARAFSGIPTIMMWDDHDIFDGWGSYPQDVQAYDVYQKIYQSAMKYFKIFQLRGRTNLLSNQDNHFAFALNFRDYSLLAMDHRAERTIKNIMSDDQWKKIIGWMQANPLRKNLLVLSGVPIVYRDFSFVESYVDATPWVEEVSDDLRDHWRAKDHQGERLRLIQQLLSELKLRSARMADPANNILLAGQGTLTQGVVQKLWHNTSAARTVVLSGDVHVGALGVIMDRRENKILKIHQVISSGIVHPPPTAMEWQGIVATTNDRNEYLNEDKTIETAMLTPVGSDKYIRARNFATLREGTDDKLWITWINETKNQDKAEYPLD